MGELVEKIPCCKYCGAEGYSWCCPSCFQDFEAEEAYPDDEEPEEEDDYE